MEVENFTPFNANDLTAQVCKFAQYSVQLLLGCFKISRLNNEELLAELYDQLSAVKNILQSFILRLEPPILSSFKHGHEVHEFLCLALGNNRGACLDLTRTLTNLKSCSNNYFRHGSVENSPDIIFESQAGQLIERLSRWVPMVYETIENETL
jgi:hypothetical protein